LKINRTLLNSFKQIDENHPQYVSPDDMELWQLAHDYLILYKVYEQLLNKSFNKTLKKFKRSEVTEIFHDFKENYFDAHPFEKQLKSIHADYLNKIFKILTQTHGSSFKPNPKRIPVGLDFISDERQFELIVYYIIAAAIISYEAPDVYKKSNQKVSFEQVKPSLKVIKASKRLLSAIREQGLWVDEFKYHLYQLSEGEPISEQLEPTKEPLTRMVREITSISEHHLKMHTKGAGRFSTKAIIQISNIVGHRPRPSIRKITPIQKRFCKKNIKPLAHEIKTPLDD
jgi:hypothetical protein